MNKFIIIGLALLFSVASFFVVQFLIPASLSVGILFFCIYAEEMEKRKLQKQDKDAFNARIEELEKKFNHSALAAILKPVGGKK